MTHILIGPKQREQVREILEKKTSNLDENDKLILHVFGLELDKDVSLLLVEFVTKQAHIQRIKLERCSGSGLAAFLQACLSSSCVELEIVDLEDFPQYTWKNDPQGTNMRRLALKSLSITASAATFLQEVHPRLCDLQLKHCQIEDREATIRSLHSKTALHRLDISQCRLAESVMAEILQAVSSSTASSLTEVDISGNDVSSQQAVTALKQLILASPQLKRLHTAKVRLHSVGPLAEAVFAVGASLEFWNLSGNQLQSSDIDLLSVSLTRRNTLKTLYLHDTDLRDDCVDGIIQRWKDWSSLRTLWIFQNPFTLEGVQSLADAFAHQNNLHELEIPKIPCNKQADQSQRREQQRLLSQYQQSIRHYGELNRNGRYLLSQDIPLGLWALVLERAAKTTTSSATSSSTRTQRLFDQMSNSTTGRPSDNSIYDFLHGPATTIRS